MEEIREMVIDEVFDNLDKKEYEHLKDYLKEMLSEEIFQDAYDDAHVDDWRG